MKKWFILIPLLCFNSGCSTVGLPDCTTGVEVHIKVCSAKQY